MVQVKADSSIRAILGAITERAEILNDDGTLLGYFEPVETGEEATYQSATLRFDPAEIEQSLKAEGVWHTTDEILDRLDSTGKP